MSAFMYDTIAKIGVGLCLLIYVIILQLGVKSVFVCSDSKFREIKEIN